MCTMERIRAYIDSGEAILGIELGSTRIKAVLIGHDMLPIATGAHSWENKLDNGVWTYDMQDAWAGLQDAYTALRLDIATRYGTVPRKFNAIGISAMMHGYLPFDREGQQLVSFRTWRNTMTLEAADALSEAFDFSVPQRWSIAHLYQAVLNGEPHLDKLNYLTTLSGYIHWQLTGEKVLGIGDASGMFPIDSTAVQHDAAMVAAFGRLTEEYNLPWRLQDILPRVLTAGQPAGTLTEQGALLLDPTGTLAAGIPLCPPEGDAPTGMVATNAIANRTGNISAGTSIFMMAVLEKPLSRRYADIDMVTTPNGSPVAMVHCNNCTTDLNHWIRVFSGFSKAAGCPLPLDKLYQVFFEQSLNGAADGGGLLSYGYYAGEHITDFEDGRPLLAWSADADFSFENLARVILFSSLATLRIGLDALAGEGLRLDRLVGHGGLYKTGIAGQRFTAAALKAPVAVMETAGEGGAWGIALLAAYLQEHMNGTPLETFLADTVFVNVKSKQMLPDQQDMVGYEVFMDRYRQGLSIARAAVRALR